MRIASILETIDKNLECKTTYATEEKNSTGGSGYTYTRSEDIPCRQAFEHLNQLYKNNLYKDIKIRDVEITKYFPTLPFIRASIEIPEKMTIQHFGSILREAGNFTNEDV